MQVNGSNVFTDTIEATTDGTQQKSPSDQRTQRSRGPGQEASRFGNPQILSCFLQSPSPPAGTADDPSCAGARPGDTHAGQLHPRRQDAAAAAGGEPAPPPAGACALGAATPPPCPHPPGPLRSPPARPGSFFGLSACLPSFQS